jgi:D-alanyl-D-alanine carboxypeptidase/D-alanyl-D-alanine-endopeptidase (penicillin-binding protein 4)
VSIGLETLDGSWHSTRSEGCRLVEAPIAWRGCGGRRADAALLLLAVALAATAAANDRDRLIFHVETASGEVIASHDADHPFNPASVTKVGTSMWALELLGPDARYETVFGSTGRWDRAAGRIAGDLVVIGGGDPDFHDENVFMVTRQLNQMGIRSFSGDLVVVPPFTIGWENGAARPATDPVDRGLDMGRRLLTALDREHWRQAQRAGWTALCDRRGWQSEPTPGVTIGGRTRVASAADPTVLVVHRSNPLAVTLRRFNVYSNNDIVRIADGLGGPGRLADYLRHRLGAGESELSLSTASGQDSNRMTARLMVALLREFLSTSEKAGLRVEELLAVPGCDPGPTREMFPRLVSGPNERTVVGKTGTLTTTDGGVVAFAGLFDSRDRGRVLFAVGAPGSGWDVRRWRETEQAWLIDLIESLGGAAERVCGPEVPHPDTCAEVVAEEPSAGD